ncbi:MAG: phosphoglucomutase/phosphomannomutase family protein [Actinobacteria bacterium]|nr:MAG: phosphoglucomutase/phosphomannomutase family protein [Actinomycetota bacterium]
MFRFGTDGYRAIISDGFDFETVGKISLALANYLKSKKAQPHVLVGYDTRFLSDKFASCAAGVCAKAGLRVEITDSFVPTPILSHSVVDKKADAGIMITASHNPYYYNGFKIKNAQGGSASPAQIAELSPFLDKINQTPKYTFHNNQTKTYNPKKNYFLHVESIVDKKLFSTPGIKIIADPMYGAGRGFFKELLQSYNLDTTEIHGQENPNFGGLQPEPIGPSMDDLKKAVLDKSADLGLALDGDADRSGAIDEKGNFISSHQIFALLLHHLVENKKQKGLVVKTFSTTSLVDIMAEYYGLEVVQTPIGFKHISDLMLSKDVLIGGEESGGIGIKGHIPERDGLLIGLMLTELMLTSEKTISELMDTLNKKFGCFSYDRLDLVAPNSNGQNFYQKLVNSNVAEAVSKKLKATLNEDGYKFEFEDRSWLMFRLSGTESVIRIYAEAADETEVKKLLDCGQALVTSLTNP